MYVLKQIEGYILEENIEEAYNLIVSNEEDLIDFAEFWNLRGILCSKIGEFSAAKGCFEQALDRDKENADYYYNLAYCFGKLGNKIDEALNDGYAFSYSRDEEFRGEISAKYKTLDVYNRIFHSANNGFLDDNPLVSIIIPTYNQKDYLKETIDSVLCQDYSNLEIIVTDDNSTDGTDEMMKAYSQHSKLRYIRREENMGPGINSQDALYNHCQAKYVMILNHDDYLVKSDYISMVIDIFKRNKSVSLVWANCYIKNEITGEFRETNYQLPEITDGREYFINYETGDFKHITGVLTSVFDRDKALALNCMTEETKSKDLFLSLKLMLIGDVAFVKDKVAVYREHQNSISYNMPVEYDYTTVDELEKLRNLAVFKSYKTFELNKWLLTRLYFYFGWRISTLIKLDQKPVAIKLLKDVTIRYPELNNYFQIK
ncbi:glycosyltransferase [Robertmurraya korlensis]|uniref:glycosyltransferase n=1 Tax=Robertmurraya korlensis TaxID=519977 RepID=UPI00203D87B8|nr:glycosyltransferase [Robertmurraya korlensis]MCM3602645.1 glycosyltransferase [Robertmurraya korlensis]